jgi:RNA polymerase sigma-70 factor (ECF subfamily)
MGVTNKEALDRYRWLVESMAHQYKHPGVELDDLIQEGFCGLFLAAQLWREDGGVPFGYFAIFRIRESIRDALRHEGKLRKSTEVSMDEISDATGLSLHDILGLCAAQEDLVGEAEQAALVDEALDRLPKPDRDLLLMWAKDGMSHEQIAQRLGISRQTVTDRYGAALAKLYRLLRRRVSLGAPRAA